MKLPASCVHVWLAFDREFSQTGILQAFEALLAPEELARRDRLKTDHLAEQFVVTRALQRSLMSHYVPQVAPPDWRFIVGEHGKPALAPQFAQLGLHFNVTHTPRLVAIAVAREPVGVDAECLRDRPPPFGVAARHFTQAEASELAALPESEKPRRFYSLWTLKESWLKATGTGITGGFGEAAFRFAGPRPSGFSIVSDDEHRWRFWQESILDEHLLALALRTTQVNEARMFRCTPGIELAGRELPQPMPVPPLSGQEQRAQS